jgi:glycosyltransferase involved in cell wall biosynthesis
MTADTVGGVWTYALNVAATLGERGTSVIVATLGPSPTEDQRRDAQRRGARLIETGRALDWTAKDPGEVLAAGRAVADLARRLRVDLLHLNSPALAASNAFDRPVLGVCHSCVATWWSAVRDGPLPLDLAWRAELVARGYRACDALAAPSTAFALATQHAYGLPEPPMLAPNGHDPDVPSFGDPDPCVITAGRLWDEGKNLAAMDAVAQDLSAPFEAAGPTRGPNGASVSPRFIKPLGRLSSDEMRRRLARRPIFASLALYEPFGLAVLEAAQAGCALLLSDIPTFRELWDGCALFCPPRDSDGARRALERILADPSLRSRLGARARERGLAFTRRRMADATLAAYSATLEAACRRAEPAA